MSAGIRDSGPAVTIHGATLPAPDYRDTRIAELTAKLALLQAEYDRLDGLSEAQDKAIQACEDKLRESEAERDRLARELAEAQTKVDLAEQSGVTFYAGDNGVGMSMPMSEELEGTLEALTAQVLRAEKAERELAEARKQTARLDLMELPECGGLDRIEVYWRNFDPGKGSVTITCYGSAWTAYFGAMSDRTIQEFFAGADTHYLVTKLGITPQLKQRKVDHAYLGRIVEAIKAALDATLSEARADQLPYRTHSDESWRRKCDDLKRQLDEAHADQKRRDAEMLREMARKLKAEAERHGFIIQAPMMVRAAGLEEAVAAIERGEETK